MIIITQLSRRFVNLKHYAHIRIIRVIQFQQTHHDCSAAVQYETNPGLCHMNDNVYEKQQLIIPNTRESNEQHKLPHYWPLWQEPSYMKMVNYPYILTLIHQRHPVISILEYMMKSTYVGLNIQYKLLIMTFGPFVFHKPQNSVDLSIKTKLMLSGILTINAPGQWF